MNPILAASLVVTSILAASPLLAQEATQDSVRFTSMDTELHGMLRIPAGPGPFPAVLLLPGGGRRFLHFEPDYFAGRLAEVGVASLVYHKRGTESSGGTWATSTLEDFVVDAGASVEVLRSHVRIGEKIGVMGFSQGGRLAPVVADRFGLDAAVSISGPHGPVAESRLHALRGSMLEAGLDEASIDTAMTMWREFIDLLLAGESTAPLDARIVAARETLPAQALPDPSQHVQPHPVFNSLHFDAGPALRRLQVPFLAMFGENDVVIPVQPSVDRLRAAAEGSGSDGLEVIVIPASGHALNDETGERHPLYDSLPVEWLAEKLGD